MEEAHGPSGKWNLLILADLTNQILMMFFTSIYEISYKRELYKLEGLSVVTGGNII